MQRILVVEDDFDIQELLQNFLQEAGYEVAVANDGVEAYQSGSKSIQRHGKDLFPSICSTRRTT